MKTRKHFTVPECIPLVHGDNRIKLCNRGNMVLWYRRDFASILITYKTYEQPVECVAVKLHSDFAHKTKTPGYLFFIPPTKGKHYRDDPLNYFLSIGDNEFMSWDEIGRPLRIYYAIDTAPDWYIIGEHFNDWILNLINKKP